MRVCKVALLLCVSVILVSSSACTHNDSQLQEAAPTRQPITQVNADIDRSRILKFRGVLKDHEGKRVTGVVGVLFAIYEQKEGGAPMWQEVQNVEADIHGRFVALLGSTKSEGIPLQLFDTEKTRWLGMQVLLPGEGEQARIRLLSTAEGLMAHGATRLVIPGNSGDQTETAEEEAPGETTDSQKDQSAPTNRSPRAKRGFHRRRPLP